MIRGRAVSFPHCYLVEVAGGSGLIREGFLEEVVLSMGMQIQAWEGG